MTKVTSSVGLPPTVSETFLSGGKQPCCFRGFYGSISGAEPRGRGLMGGAGASAGDGAGPQRRRRGTAVFPSLGTRRSGFGARSWPHWAWTRCGEPKPWAGLPISVLVGVANVELPPSTTCLEVYILDTVISVQLKAYFQSRILRRVCGVSRRQGQLLFGNWK